MTHHLLACDNDNVDTSDDEKLNRPSVKLFSEVRGTSAMCGLVEHRGLPAMQPPDAQTKTLTAL